jgi:hypothetical protein
MGRVIAFPGAPKAKRPPVKSAAPVLTSNVPAHTDKPGALSHVFSVTWILFLLTWPLVQKIMAFDIAYQFFRALYYWHVPGTYAGCTFFIHLIAGSALTYFVATRPIK